MHLSYFTTQFLTANKHVLKHIMWYHGCHEKKSSINRYNTARGVIKEKE